MAYVTVRNIESETSYLKNDWTTFVLKELEDNAFDWLNAFYPAITKEDIAKRKISVRIWLTYSRNYHQFVHIAVRNSNVDNLPTFDDLDETFDFDICHSTKRYQHGMTCGSLGDALKRCLGMGYAYWISSDKPDAYDETLVNKQWDEPIILRFNSYEYKAFIKVDRPVQKIWTEIERQLNPARDIGTDTEVEVPLPVPYEPWWGEEGNWLTRLKRYYRDYKIGKSRTEFRIDCKEEEEA